MDNAFLKTEIQQTILIVDDSIENLQVLSALLKDDFKTKVAKSGQKALEILDADPGIDLILLDIMMPEMNGYEVCQRIKSNSLIQKIPVIFLTALNESSDETKGFQVGGADFIMKPFNADVVKARIKTHISLQEERKISTKLLEILLPTNVISDLITKGSYTPETHQNTSVLFCDLVGFTDISSKISPIELINELTDIFTEFDEISSRNKITRIKTIGDAYMAVAGIDQSNDVNHAENCVKAGLDFIEFLKKRNLQKNIAWKCRIGIHSGEIISGLVGKSRFQFDVMGDNVNIAARVESNGLPMEVTITDYTKTLLPTGMFDFESLGRVLLKGKGEMHLNKVRKA